MIWSVLNLDYIYKYIYIYIILLFCHIISVRFSVVTSVFYRKQHFICHFSHFFLFDFPSAWRFSVNQEARNGIENLGLYNLSFTFIHTCVYYTIKVNNVMYSLIHLNKPVSTSMIVSIHSFFFLTLSSLSEHKMNKLYVRLHWCVEENTRGIL